MTKAYVHIMLKDSVLDPQGETIRRVLKSLGFEGIEGLRQGKLIEIDLVETDMEKAREMVVEMCEKLLSNTVIESYRVEIMKKDYSL